MNHARWSPFSLTAITLSTLSLVPIIILARSSARQPELTSENARQALQEMALHNPNPFVRAAAYHEHDADWTIDVANHTFTLKITEPKQQSLDGKFTLRADAWVPEFNDPKAVETPWIPPPHAKFTPDQIRAALIALGKAVPRDQRLRQLGEQLKTAPIATEDDGKTYTIKTAWVKGTISVENRTFNLREGSVDVFHGYEGKLGWDKNHQWVAWPTVVTDLRTQGGIHMLRAIAIPKPPETASDPITPTQTRP